MTYLPAMFFSMQLFDILKIPLFYRFMHFTIFYMEVMINLKDIKTKSSRKRHAFSRMQHERRRSLHSVRSSLQKKRRKKLRNSNIHRVNRRSNMLKTV